jgi:rhodanese-related sulfurtransferase
MRPFLNAILILSALSISQIPAQTPSLKESDLISPADFAAHIKGPLLLQVGFPVLYRAAHIPGSEYAGPGSKPEGIEALKKAVAGQPKDREIVLYCGCCPWDKCPNVKPAIAALKEMGYTNVKAMVIKENFKTDWADKNYPVEKRAEQ